MMLEDKIVELAGDDIVIVQRCSPETRSRFFQMGLFVPLLFLLSVISSYFIFSELLSHPLMPFALSLFFAWMLTNIYRLLLYTLTRSALPDIATGITYSKTSLALRLTFVCFISLLISKPIECRLYATGLNEDISVYKQEEKTRQTKKINNYYNAEFNELNKVLANNYYVITQFKKKENERIKTIQAICLLVDSSEHYLQRLRILNTKYPSCWLISLFFMLLLNVPLSIKHTLRQSDYFTMKGLIEQRIVEVNYYAFRKKYSTLFYKKTGSHRSFGGTFEDPPYNTIKKQDKRKFLEEENLLSELYNA
ncbi:MAG: DUF4407 domain-containing protein [Bacteroidia bacterium]|nr:DUF4407 domain-containing protein [Bacteroidia bacterium]